MNKFDYNGQQLFYTVEKNTLTVYRSEKDEQPYTVEMSESYLAQVKDAEGYMKMTGASDAVAYWGWLATKDAKIEEVANVATASIEERKVTATAILQKQGFSEKDATDFIEAITQ